MRLTAQQKKPPAEDAKIPEPGAILTVKGIEFVVLRLDTNGLTLALTQKTRLQAKEDRPYPPRASSTDGNAEGA